MKRTQIAEPAYTGINVSEIPVGGGVAGFLITVCIIVVALIGLPPTRWFLAASVVLGVVMALIRRWTAPDR